MKDDSMLTILLPLSFVTLFPGTPASSDVVFSKFNDKMAEQDTFKDLPHFSDSVSHLYVLLFR